jgi:methylated-DNA-protein-cysteine methyltransferase-like protein
MVRIDEDFFEAVYELTKMIPKGQVATYGQIATYVVSPRHARAVGRALKLLSKKRSKEVPWQRVINASGRISIRGEVERPIVQRRLLEKEGIVFDASDKTNLDIFGWAGPPPTWRPPYADPRPAKTKRRAGRR